MIPNNISQSIESEWGATRKCSGSSFVYINDIHNVINNSFLNLFAGDMLICVTGYNFKEITDTLNLELEVLYDWPCQHNLKLNASKKKSMVVGSTKYCKKCSQSG